MEVRLGQLLIESGVLTAAQVKQILDHQLRSGEPFGLIAEQVFHVNPRLVERAWASQYASLSPNLNLMTEVIDPRALSMVTRRQAWQFRVLPIRFDEGELMMATTQHHLRRALRFVTGVIGVPVYFVIATPRDLGEALCKHYPMAGMTPTSVDDDAMDRILKIA
jgi:hypothetical protein